MVNGEERDLEPKLEPCPAGRWSGHGGCQVAAIRKRQLQAPYTVLSRKRAQHRFCRGIVDHGFLLPIADWSPALNGRFNQAAKREQRTPHGEARRPPLACKASLFDRGAEASRKKNQGRSHGKASVL